jgi:PPK2 family polyphosphate:nucleotide phosphotransferase
MDSILPDDFKVIDTIKLSKIPTRFDINATNQEKKEKLLKVQQKLSKKQDAMYAHNKYAFLICLQGMDTSGKDSLIREVFKEFNPRGVVVESFKTPTPHELEHDFLWRHYVALPEKGKFAVFNRTHYENVLVTRVHPEYLLSVNLPGIEKLEDIKEDFWDNRFESINHFEKHLAHNGTIVLKFFLHLSKDEQKKRLLNRLENPEDNWKFSVSDLQERERWDDYMKYYEEAINRIWEAMQQLTDIKEPELDPKIKANIDIYKKQLQ